MQGKDSGQVKLKSQKISDKSLTLLDSKLLSISLSIVYLLKVFVKQTVNCRCRNVYSGFKHEVFAF